MSLTAGTSISQYKVIARLGSGGMGEVYLAQDERLRRKVALKLLFEEVTKNEDWVRRFEQEAYAASALNHPNIITIYEVGQTSDSHFISTEFIDGQTLRERLRQQNLAINETLEIAIQVAGALVAAHAAGIIHRDIKPENVMLRTDGYVKVLDFGLAKFTEQRTVGSSHSDQNAETEAGFNTSPGVIMGTVSYMSPEQASGSHVDARTDIFSLGVLIYEMLSGRLPFEGTTPSEIIVSIIQKRQRPIARYAPEIPSELERIVGKSLSKNRDDRYQSLKDMLIDLKRLKRQLDLAEDLDDSSELVPGHEPSTSGRHISQRTGEQKYVTQPAVSDHVSSAQYIVTGIKQHKKAALISAAVVLTAILLGAYYFMSRPNNTIAVLPFTSDDAETERLGDEMAVTVRHELSKISALRVISVNSAQYKGRSIDPKSVGRELGVRAVVVGEILKRDNSFIVRVNLIDTRDGQLLWGFQKTVKLNDLALVPSDVVNSVAGTIGVKETADEKKKREAQNFYDQGRYAWNKRSTENITEAIRKYEQALEIDPNHAQAHAAIADCYNLLVSYGARSPKDAFPKARKAAEKALSINPNLAEAHAALAYTIFRFDWKWDEAEREFKQAISLKNEYASAHQWYALLLAARGLPEDAKRETRKAQEVDKKSPSVMAHMGLICYFGRCFDQAITESTKTLEVEPDFSPARRYLGLAYAQKTMYAEALGEFEKVMSKSRTSALARAEYAHALAISGESSKAESELNSLIERSKQEYVSAYHIATIYAGLKQKEKALEWLRTALRDRADWLPYLKVDPRFDSLRTDSGFQDILREMNLDR